MKFKNCKKCFEVGLSCEWGPSWNGVYVYADSEQEAIKIYNELTNPFSPRAVEARETKDKVNSENKL